MGGRGAGSGGSNASTAQKKKAAKIKTSNKGSGGGGGGAPGGGGQATELKGKKQKEFEDKLTEKYKTTMTQHESKMASEYGGATFKKINPALRTGNTKKLDKFYKEIIKTLDNAISKSPLGQKIVLFRGVSQKEINQIMKMKPGQTHTNKAFTSTSTSKKSADIFARGTLPGSPKNVIIKYNTKSSTKGLSVNALNRAKAGTSHQHAFPNEKEIILARGQKSKFKGWNKRGSTVIAEFDLL